MSRLNITLPDKIAAKLASKPNKSRYIADALKEKFECERKKEIEDQMAEGYKTSKNEDKQINDEWEKAGLERWD